MGAFIGNRIFIGNKIEMNIHWTDFRKFVKTTFHRLVIYTIPNAKIKCFVAVTLILDFCDSIAKWVLLSYWYAF
jgi:hypothetical protein